MRPLIISACLMAVLASCSKKDNNGGSTTSTANVSIDGVTDITVKQDSSNYLALQVKNLSGQEKVTLSAQNLPKNVSASFSAESGTPLFGSVVTITAAANADTGKHPIIIRGTTASGASKDYNLTLNVAYKQSCASKVEGNYNDSYSCDGGLHGTTAETIAIDPSASGQVILETPAGGKFTATVDCSTNTITIPQQKNSNNATIAGNGHFGSNFVSILYTVSGNQCSDAFTK